MNSDLNPTSENGQTITCLNNYIHQQKGKCLEKFQHILLTAIDTEYLSNHKP